MFKRTKQIDTERSEYFTGEKQKKLLVHVMQNGIEVDKPIKTVIFKQQVEWKNRIFPIQPLAFVIDHNGVHHQYVNANTTGALAFDKAPDMCVKCGGKLSIDARNARDLLKRKTIEAIWGIDSTHIILLIIVGIFAIGMMGFAMYEMLQEQSLQSKVDSALATNSLKPLAPNPASTQTSQQTTTVIH